MQGADNDVELLRCFTTGCTSCGFVKGSRKRQCLMTYNALHDHAPVYSKNLVILILILITSNVYNFWLRSTDCISSSCADKVQQMVFAHAGPTAWKKLPPEVRLSPTLAIFKNKLKIELIEFITINFVILQYIGLVCFLWNALAITIVM